MADDDAEQPYIPDNLLDKPGGISGFRPMAGGYLDNREQRLNNLLRKGGRGCFVGMALVYVLPVGLLGVASLLR